jgi:hypothetical protein
LFFRKRLLSLAGPAASLRCTGRTFSYHRVIKLRLASLISEFTWLLFCCLHCLHTCELGYGSVICPRHILAISYLTRILLDIVLNDIQIRPGMNIWVQGRQNGIVTVRDQLDIPTPRYYSTSQILARNSLRYMIYLIFRKHLLYFWLRSDIININ